MHNVAAYKDAQQHLHNMNKGHIQAERAEAIHKAMNTGTQENVENVNRYTPMLIADGVRGIHAPRFAAQNIERMIVNSELRYSGHTVRLTDIADAGSLRPTEEAEAERWAEAWNKVTRGLFYVGTDTETEYRVHEDEQGVFLVPEGYDMERV